MSAAVSLFVDEPTSGVRDTIPAPAPPHVMTYERAAEQFEPLVRKLTRRFRDHVDQDDIRQEAFLGLFSACDTWRDDGGMTFLSWATMCIRHFVGRAAQRIRRRGLTPTFRDEPNPPELRSFDAPLTGGDASDVDTTLHDLTGKPAVQADELGDAEERAFVRAVASSLSTRHRAVVDAHLEGLTLEQVSRRHGMSRESARLMLLAVTMQATKQAKKKEPRRLSPGAVGAGRYPTESRRSATRS